MKSAPELITDEGTFLRLRSQCEMLIDTQKRLPDYVFRRPFAKYFAIEHGAIHGKEFISFVSRIASLSEDESISYMTIQPDPVEYYFHHHHFYGLASFQPSSLAERYLSAMYRDGAADSFLARGGDIGAFWGSSQKWAIFCDRISWELAVIAVSREMEPLADFGLRPMDEFLLRRYMESIWFADKVKAREFTTQLAANYRL